MNINEVQRMNQLSESNQVLECKELIQLPEDIVNVILYQLDNEQRLKLSASNTFLRATIKKNAKDDFKTIKAYLNYLISQPIKLTFPELSLTRKFSNQILESENLAEVYSLKDKLRREIYSVIKDINPAELKKLQMHTELMPKFFELIFKTIQVTHRIKNAENKLNNLK